MAKNIIWETNEQLKDEWDVAQNIEVRYHDIGAIEIRITRATERDDPISLSKLLTPTEAIRLGTELVATLGV